MTVSMQLTKRIYQGNGITRRWDVDFPLVSSQDVRIRIVSPEGTETEVSGDFSLDLLTRTLTYPTLESGKEPLQSGWRLTVFRQTPLTQEIDLIRQGELDAEVLEAGYDKLTLMVQELNEKVNRSIKYPISTQEQNLDTEHFLNNILRAKEGALSAAEQAVSSAEEARESVANAQDTIAQVEAQISEAALQGKQTVLQAGQEAQERISALGEEAKKSAQEAKQYAEKTVAKCIGEVFYSQSSSEQDNPGALPLFTGESVSSAETLYPDFYCWLTQHPELQTTPEAYEQALNTFGECPYYVLAEGSLRLPKLAHFIKMANAAEGIGQSSAGLPNITGSFSPGSGTGFSSNFARDGAFTSGGASHGNKLNGTNGEGDSVGFDASMSNPIYGSSSTVTPAHTTLYPWVVAYHAGQEMYATQAEKWNELLNRKADISLENLSAEGAEQTAALSMPGERFEGLNLLESASTYTAPACGYFQLTIQAVEAGEYIRLQNNTAGGISAGMSAASGGVLLSAYVPAQEGDSVSVYYTAGGVIHAFRFVYARGSQRV
ncbi:MAG: hypothetical protein IJP25_00460 [Elusimicrobiaceae bacterium]|nr:hypothetical protein [Elusimicrobiaceae bacterium]